ncbi:MAG TPA: phosphate signaling complex protein PhoU [Aggregatilinea sp.]|jgi:phosphate transport system protein|uniref:phosphate signaling complex protein PhoU n=1 Tax=Aggregatilinea sp. TaxID=2806333 RepID=UPI002CFE4BD3|nr:phosphate signaling complex protein PhoU [Aggregatilinea sp.]HML22883.1 phosphate signaling complex protein PhoU [Aggregatilinea sp.]
MSPREQFERELQQLSTSVQHMGNMVENQLKLALDAFEALDLEQARLVAAIDRDVNAQRFAIEETCFKIIVTQQPAARDLRAIIAALNIIVDLERIGDKAKDLTNTIPDILAKPSRRRPPELARMGELVRSMLQQCMEAYATKSTDLAKQVPEQADQLDKLFDSTVNYIVEDILKAKKEKKITAAFAVLRAAQHLDRIGDLAVNVAERIVYIETGNVEEMKVHVQDSID